MEGLHTLRILLFLVVLRTCFCLRFNCPFGTPNRDDGLCDVEPTDEDYTLSCIHPMSATAQMSHNYNSLYYSNNPQYTLHRVRRGIVLQGLFVKIYISGDEYSRIQVLVHFLVIF